MFTLVGEYWLKVLGIVCSPRKKGNTEILVLEALAGAEEVGAYVEILRAGDMDIAPCDGCRSCRETGECKIKDDMQKVYKKLLEAEGIILGSPVYFWSVSGQTKNLIDRTYALRYNHQKLKDKVGGAIVVAGRRGCLSALSVFNNFFLGQEMIPVGLGVDGRGREKGDVRKDERAMKDARTLGRRLGELIKCLS